MPEDPPLDVLYNDTCPVCRFEIGHYAKAAGRQGLPLRFDPLDRAEGWGLTRDQAARRLHVRRGGEMLSGLAAFRAIWAAMPRWRWLARLTGLPVVNPALAFAYDRLVGPWLYRRHLARQVLRGG